MDEKPVRAAPCRGRSFLQLMLFLIVLCLGIILMNPRVKDKLHHGLINSGDYLPEFVNTWMKSLHDSKPKKTPAEKDSKGKVIGKSSHNWINGPSKLPHLKLFTLDDIKFVEGGKWYLVLIGHVFDVTGAEFYKPGSGYHAFIGQDASRSFITGEFTNEAVTDNLVGLQGSDYIGLSTWLKFYMDHETYKFVGYLIGKYFDAEGKETVDMAEVKELMKWANSESAKEEDMLKLFPSCNVEWKAATGSTLWCSAKSGGVDRDWIGYPRKFFEKPDKSARCACIHPNYLADPRVKEYEGCSPTSDTCKLLEADK